MAHSTINTEKNLKLPMFSPVFPIFSLEFRYWQGFIQALLLTSIFHEGLSFMEVDHKPMCINTLAPWSWRFIWGTVNSPPLPYGIAPKALTITPVKHFQIALACIIQYLIFSFFKTIFIRLAWWLRLPTNTH